MQQRKLRFALVNMVISGKSLYTVSNIRAVICEVLTSFECHDTFQAGELGRVKAHLSESGDHLLKRLNLRHNLIHPLRLRVFSVHPFG